MSDATTELGLQLAVDADDTADYLTIGLRQSLQSIDGLYNQAAGHTHSGPHQGGLIAAAAFGGPMDLPDWFRSTGQRSGLPSSGVGLEMFWDGTEGVLQGYDRGASAYRPMRVLGSDLTFNIAGLNALEITPNHDLSLYHVDGSKGVNIRPRAGATGIEFVNVAYTAVTFSVDDSGNVTIPGSATVGGPINLSGVLNVSGATVLTALTVNGLLTATANIQMGNRLRLTWGDTNSEIMSYDRQTIFDEYNGGWVWRNTATGSNSVMTLGGGGNLSVIANVTAAGNIISTGGVVQAGAAVASMSGGDISANRGGGSGWLFLGDTNHRLEYNSGQNYVLRNGGLSCDWLATNTGGRNSSYGLTLPNQSSRPGPGWGIAFGWDTYSAARGKQDITPIAEALAVITHPNVHGVTYQPLGGGPDMVGFVAEDWHAVLPSVVSLDEDGNPQALDYGRIGAVTFQAVKELAAQVQALQEQLQAHLAAQEEQQTP